MSPLLKTSLRAPLSVGLLSLWITCLPGSRSTAASSQPFLRGDVDQDGRTSLSDVLGLLDVLLQGGAAGTCRDALDADGDGHINTADAVRILGHLFTGGEPPAAPFPDCGPDPRGAGLGCDAHRACERTPPRGPDPRETLPALHHGEAPVEGALPDTGNPAQDGERVSLGTRESRAFPSVSAGGGGGTAAGIPIALGETVTGEITGATDVDTYLFAALPGTRIAVDRLTASSPNGLNWSLTDAWGRVLASDPSALNDLGPVNLPGGDFTLKVTPEGSGGGTYSFRVVEAPEVKAALALQETVNGSIPPDHVGQRNVYTFDALPGQKVFLESLATGNVSLNWELVDAFGRATVASRRVADHGPVRLLGGSYELRIEGFLSSGQLTSGGYEIRIVALDTAGPTALALGQIATGEIALPGEVDAYAIAVPSSQLIFLDLLASSNSGSLDYELLDGEGRQVLARTTSILDTGPMALVGGSYELHILGEGGATGSYQFRVTDATASQVAVTTGVEISGEVPADRPGVVSSHEFSVAGGRNLTIELLQSSNTGSLDWQLEDAFGRVVLPRTTSLATVGPIAVSGGTYSLKVLPEGGSTGTFRFRIRDDGPASYTPTGTPITPGTPVDASITTPGGSISYTWTNSVPGALHYVDLLTAHADLDWQLLDSMGRSFALVRANSTDGSDLGPFPLAAGTYTLLLKARTATATPSCRFLLANAPVTTQPAAPGQVITGSFQGFPGSVHRREFSLPAPTRVFLDRRIGSVRLAWTLLDGAGEAVFPLRRADGVDNDEGPFDLAAGSYTLILDPEFGYQPDYEIALVSVNDEEGAVAIGQTITGSFAGSPGATRNFTLAVEDGARVYLDRLTATTRLDWSLRDSGGELLFGPTSANTADSDQGPFTLAGGVYTLTLDPQAGYEPSYDFRVVDAAETISPLQLGVATSGTLAPGARAIHELTVLEGERIYFDLEVGHSSLRWSLLDSFGQAVVAETPATGPTLDLPPRNLAAGTYQLVLDATFSNAPSYSFTAWKVSADLLVEGYLTEERVFFAGGVDRRVNVTWFTRNAGAGPEPAPAAVDRLILSSDSVRGNADDIVLGSFFRGEPLAAHEAQARSASVELPESLALGLYHLFLHVDADDAIAEPGGEGDNVGDLVLQVVEDLPQIEPEFVATTSFPFVHTAKGPGGSCDVPLARPVPLDRVRHVAAEAFNIQLTGPRNDTAATITLGLLSGQEEVLEVSSVFPSAGQGTGTFIVRFSRRLTPQVVALLPNRTIDGLRFHFDQSPSVETTIKPIQSDGQARVTLAGCEFAPCGPHLERKTPGAESATFVGTGTSEWKTITFAEPVPGDGLRFISGPTFSATVTNSAFVVGAATSEVQLFLDNGALVTLDDARSPSTLAGPAFLALSNSHSLDLQPGQLAGRQILGFQWRIHASSAGLGSATSLYEPLDDLAIRFLHDAEACRGSIALPPVELAPADGAAFAPGSHVTISGRALSPSSGRPVSAVLVNGEAVDSLDSAGHFFKTVEIAPGDNLYAVGVVEPGCGEYQTLLHFQGLTDGASGLDAFGDATALLRLETTDTTHRRDTRDLVIRARVRNVSALPVRGPILLVLPNLSPPETVVRASAGTTETGEPYVVLLEGSVLAPGAAGPYVTIPFSTGSPRRVTHDVRWLVPSNRAPHFESAPLTRATPGATYSHRASASDPDGDPVTFRLEVGPAGMSLDSTTGLLTWAPSAEDAGTHTVTIVAEDGLGGSATQSWTLLVGPPAANRPPHFTTTPVASAGVGAAYLYAARAVDPESLPVTYTLLAAPVGMEIAPDGDITWPLSLPGEHEVAVEARDPQGSSSEQRFTLGVGSLPSNPGAPRITTSPSTEAVPGILFIYQPVASDPDGDVLTFTLEEAPPGLAMSATTGRIEWTPQVDQVGSHAVRFVARDGRGGESRQSFTIVVGSAGATLPPVIESVPGHFAVAGTEYVYQVSAVDPEGEPLVFSLSGQTAGLSIHPGTGLVTWTPLPADAGARVVTVEAADPQGAVGRQTFEIEVRASNAGPVVTSPAPPTSVVAGGTWQYDLSADDPNGDIIRYEILGGPSALDVQPVTGLSTWRTSPGDVGSHSVVLRALDCCGGEAILSFAIEVEPDSAPPLAGVGFTVTPIDVGGTTQVQLSASDNAAVATRTLSVEQAPAAARNLTLDALGRAFYSSSEPGYAVFTGTVVDASGNSTVATAVLQVGNPDDPLDPHPPVVTVLSPAPGSVVTSVVDIAASVTDATEDGKPGSGPITWLVELAPQGSDDFEQLGTGSGEVTSQVLARLDPTVLQNGVYKLRITGNDGVQIGGLEYELSVAGDLKLGNYTMAFVDLALPLAGLPVVISRRYNSLDPSPGEFGAGWRLGLAGEVEDSARESHTGIGLVDLLGAEPFHPGTRIYVTLPDGRRTGFTFQGRSAGGLFAYAYFPELVPDPGVQETLEILEPAGSFFLIGGNASQIGVPYNPTRYRLKTKEGVAYIIDEDDGLVRIEDPAGNAIDVRPEGLFSSTGAALHFERDQEGRIVKIVEPGSPGDPAAPGFVEYFYDASGNLQAFRDVAGAETRFFYETQAFPHHLTRIEDPSGGNAVRIVLDDDGRLLAQCGPDGNPDTLEGCQTFSYDPGARLETSFDGEGNRRDRFLDEQGHTLTERFYLEDGSTREVSFAYDAAGLMTSWTLPGGATWEYAHDDAGHLARVVDPVGRVRSYTYSSCGRVASESDPLGASQGFSFDESCNVTREVNPLGHVTQHVRDSLGNRVGVVDANGEAWSFELDSNGNPAAATDPLGRRKTFTINAVGELLSSVDRNGRRIDFTHDSAHRVTSETWATTPPRTTTYEYNGAGQLVRASDPDSTVILTYHPNGKLASIDNAGSPGTPRVLVELDYNLNGQLERVADSLGGVTSYTHDAVGALATILQTGVGVSTKRVDFLRDQEHRISRIERSSDAAGATLVASTEVLHDTAGDATRRSGLHHRGPGGQPLHLIDLVRDDAANVLQMSDAEGTHTYVHDALGQILSADHPAGGPQPDETYSFDGVGHRVSSHLSPSHVTSADLGQGGHQLVQDSRFDYEHDLEGNVTRRTDRATGEATAFTWDFRNRLTAVERLSPQGASLGKTTYGYDALGRRVKVSSGGSTVHIVSVGGNPALEVAQDGTVLVRRLHGLDLDEVYAEERAGTTRWLLVDQVGSVRDVLGPTGALLAHYAYDSFGRRLLATGDANATTLGFQGRPLDAETGLLDFRARTYDPFTGRFLSEDPEAPYRYNFALNDPLRWTDPTGRSVAIEYACLAAEAVSFGKSFQENIASPVGKLFEEIAESIATLTQPPPGSLNALTDGLGDYLGSVGGFPTDPDDLSDLPTKFALGMFCTEFGTSGAAARAQGKASSGGPSGFSWTGTSWSK